MNQCIQTNVPEFIVFAIAFEKENVADVVTWVGTRFGIGAIFLLQFWEVFFVDDSYLNLMGHDSER